MREQSPPSPNAKRLNDVLLGSPSTYRNAHRNWLYLGFVVLVVAVIAAKAFFAHGSR